jgi:hypothetical protein
VYHIDFLLYSTDEFRTQFDAKQKTPDVMNAADSFAKAPSPDIAAQVLH